MDRLIWITWRAFWVGLGASAVLIAQSVLAPRAPAPSPSSEMTPPAYVEPAATPRKLERAKSVTPILSRNPGAKAGSMRGPRV